MMKQLNHSTNSCSMWGLASLGISYGTEEFVILDCCSVSRFTVKLTSIFPDVMFVNRVALIQVWSDIGVSIATYLLWQFSVSEWQSKLTPQRCILTVYIDCHIYFYVIGDFSFLQKKYNMNRIAIMTHDTEPYSHALTLSSLYLLILGFRL